MSHRPVSLFGCGEDGEEPESVGQCVDRLTGGVKVPLLLPDEDMTYGPAS